MTQPIHARPATRSQHPGPIDAETTRTVRDEGGTLDPTKRDAAERAKALSVHFTATLPEEVYAAYAGSITDEVARLRGCRHAPTDVFHEFERCASEYAPYIAAKRLRGYGPLRARYGNELLLTLAPEVAKLEEAAVGAKVAATKVVESARLTRKERLLALRSLRNLTAGDVALQQRLRDAAANNTATGRVTVLERITLAVDHVRASFPVAALDDAGLTSSVLAGLVTVAHNAAAARTTARRSRQSRQQLRGDMAVTCGRLLHELRLMLASARDSRKYDPTIPSLSSWLVTGGKAPQHVATRTATPVIVAPTTRVAAPTGATMPVTADVSTRAPG